jgi:hypothetical protein
MRLYKLIIVTAMFSMVACASGRSQPVKIMGHDEQGSVIYIYRPSSFSNVVVSPGVMIDGKERFLINNDKYAYVTVAPGEHSIKLNLEEHYQGDFEHEINIKTGKKYFLRVDTSIKFVQGKPFIREFNLSEVSTEVGLGEIKDCKYIKSEMPSKYLFKKGASTEESRFTIEKTSDPFSKNKSREAGN